MSPLAALRARAGRLRAAMSDATTTFLEDLGALDDDCDGDPEMGEVDADSNDFEQCQREGRRTPHAMRGDGSRRCWNCGHETAGDQ
ncbi:MULTISPECIES: hypothetical protein [unclassified Streptomyces]|uniref:hypothetical protein n=1 Tax=unclassified Streptomyces TaxID=2593676 RepID=UPI00036A533C|nr:MULTISPECIES: hypothetical protein [unclassified Streptomyces]MYX33456.1 hypothetical protein [Streptomyces sp. SID8377]